MFNFGTFAWATLPDGEKCALDEERFVYWTIARARKYLAKEVAARPGCTSVTVEIRRPSKGASDQEVLTLTSYGREAARRMDEAL
jgi:hypothetical protein